MNALRISLFVAALLPLSSVAGDKVKSQDPKAKTNAPHPAHTGEHKADCHHPPLPKDAEAKAPAGSAGGQAQGWVLTRGEKLSDGPAVSLAELLASPAKHDGKTLKVEGKVRKACEKKGCWMELAQDAKKPGVRVTFKDYGFFVPLDSEGSQARVEGKVVLAQLSEERAKHYESEGAIVPRTKEGKPQEVQLVATGVELRR